MINFPWKNITHVIPIVTCHVNKPPSSLATETDIFIGAPVRRKMNERGFYFLTSVVVPNLIRNVVAVVVGFRETNRVCEFTRVCVRACVRACVCVL